MVGTFGFGSGGGVESAISAHAFTHLNGGTDPIGNLPLLNVTQTFSAYQTLSAGLAVQGGTTLTGAFNLVTSGNTASITGNTSIVGGLTVSAGLTLPSGGISVTGNSSVAGTFSTTGLYTASGGITVSSGVLTVQAGTAAAPSIVPTGNTNTGVWYPATSTIAWSTAGNERMRITSAGNVGIGTSSPSYTLEVSLATAAASTTSARLVDSAAATGESVNYLRVEKGAGYGGALGGYLSQGVGSGLIFSTLNSATLTERMRITSAGNVGIGTTTPGQLLHVAGRVLIGGATTAALWDISADLMGINRNTSSGAIYDTTGHAYQWVHFKNTVAASNYLTLQVYTPAGGSVTGNAIAISGAGFVGIGTASPAVALDVAGEIRSTASTVQLFLVASAGTGGYIGTRSNHNLFIRTNDTDRMIVTSAGNVGIGTNNPTEFHVYRANAGSNLMGIFENSSAASASNAILQVKSNASNGYAGLAITSDSSDYIFFQKQNGTEDARITVAGSTIYFAVTSSTTEKMRINSTGIGIGSISPSYSLHLAADSAAKPTSNTWTISSDARVKDVIGSYTRGVADIVALEPKRYRLNGAFGSVDDGRVHVSVIAQEAQATWPEMIGTYDHTDKNEDDVETVTELLNLNTNELQWALVNAIKELATRIATLEQRA